MSGETELKITVLIEDTAGGRGILAEHGLSLLIERGGRTVLLDTGQTGQTLLHNAGQLGVDLGNIDTVVLSHGHYDHTGGLAALLKEKPGLAIHAHPDAFLPRYAGDEAEESRMIGSPLDRAGLLRAGAVLHEHTAPFEMERGWLLTGEVPRTSVFEHIPARFLVRRRGSPEHDLIRDDQALCLETVRGAVVILGCCHAGVVNTLTYAHSLTGGRIRAVVGGMHLGETGEERLRLTIDCLEDLGVERVIPLHCTGFTACAEMRRRLGDRCEPARAGDVIRF